MKVTPFPFKGFTLIEIMVALTIVAITLGAIIENTTSSNRNAQYLRDKTVANWVGLNQLSLMRARRDWGNRSNRQGTVEMAGQDWEWRMTVRKTDDANMRRLEVRVFKQDEEEPMAMVTGFMGRL